MGQTNCIPEVQTASNYSVRKDEVSFCVTAKSDYRGKFSRGTEEKGTVPWVWMECPDCSEELPSGNYLKEYP